MRRRHIVFPFVLAVLLLASPAANAKARAKGSAPSSVAPPYSSLLPRSSCQVTGAATCADSAVTADPATGHVAANAKVEAHAPSSGTSTQEGVLSTTLGLSASEPTASLEVTFTLTDPFSNLGSGQSSFITLSAYGLGCGGACYSSHTFQFCATCDGGYPAIGSPAKLSLAISNAKGGSVPAQNFVVTVTPGATAQLNNSIGLSQANLELTIDSAELA